LLKELKIEDPRVDHQDHGIRFGDEERGLGHARDGWAVEDDSSVRLAERAQESRDVGRRDVGGVPKRHPGRNQFQARVARQGQQVGRAVGDGNVTHAGGEIDPEDLVQLRLAQVAIDRDDEGGNKVAVTFFDAPMSLHAVWDIGLIEKRTYDWGQYVTILENNWLAGKDVRALQGGTPVDWALQAHAAAVDVAYVLPEDLKLGDAYYQRSLPTVDRQLALAGIRLARLLNEAFGHAGYAGERVLRREPL